MAITLSKILSGIEKDYDMKLVAGSAGMSNQVRWVHMIEDGEVPSFLHGKELVFTTGIAQKGAEWLLNFITDVYKTGACGVVINIGPYIMTIPQQIIKFCEENNFPLFSVPWHVHLIDITYELCHRIISSEQVEIGIATAFKNLIFMPNESRSYKPVLERRGFHDSSDYKIIAVTAYKDSEVYDNDGFCSKLKFEAQQIIIKYSKPNCLFFQEKVFIAVIEAFEENEAAEFISQLEEALIHAGEKVKLYSGISPPQKGLSSISDSYKKAVFANRIAVLKDKQLMKFNDTGIYKLLASVEDRTILQEMYDNILGTLAENDKKSGTDYMKILRCYIEHDSSVQEVAEISFVHRNTINYKLKRIKEILGYELDQQNKFMVMLAFYIKDLL